MSTASSTTQDIVDDYGIEPPRLVIRPLITLDEVEFFQLVVQNRDLLRLEQDEAVAVPFRRSLRLKVRRDSVRHEARFPGARHDGRPEQPQAVLPVDHHARVAIRKARRIGH